jgi:class 3 adenylate cyclase
MPETRYAVTQDDVFIAYQVFGSGPDLMWIWALTTNIEIAWEEPRFQRIFRELAASHRVIVFDKRGVGLSDHVALVPDMEKRADDVRAVLDAVGSERVVLCGDVEGGQLAAFFAATYPERVRALVMTESRARNTWAPDYPFGETEEEMVEWNDLVRRSWGSGAFVRWWVEQEWELAKDDPDFIRWLARWLRHGAAPGTALAFTEMFLATDIRGILGSIRVPTLVLSYGDETTNEECEDLARRIPGARHVPIPGVDRFFGLGRDGLDVIERFLAEVGEEEASLDRVLATVLFTDIVGSTSRAAEIGDHAWADLVERHHATVRTLLGRFRGHEWDTAGDGFYATFDGPARAIRCAQAIVEAVRALGIEVRAGLHIGECESIDGKLGGLSVAIGARVGALAGPGEILVSGTVKDLVVGSGFSFEDTGEHELKGVPDRWRVFRLVD